MAASIVLAPVVSSVVLKVRSLSVSLFPLPELFPFPISPPCFGLGGVEGIGLLGVGGFVMVGDGVGGGRVAFAAPADMGEGWNGFSLFWFWMFFPVPLSLPFPVVTNSPFVSRWKKNVASGNRVRCNHA